MVPFNHKYISKPEIESDWKPISLRIEYNMSSMLYCDIILRKTKEGFWKEI